nr:hypothetical protein [Tanacetum cinerariifolium]
IRSEYQEEDQAGSDPGEQAESQPRPTPGVLAGSNPEPPPADVGDPSRQQQKADIGDGSTAPPSAHIDEGFTATVYPNIQENLKLPVHEPVIPEEPVSSTGTLSSLQQLTRVFSFVDQFINDKPTEADNEKTTAETEQPSMTESRTIKRMGELEHLFKGVVERNTAVEERLHKHWDYFEAEKAEKQAKKRRKQDSPKTPPGSPPHLHHHHHQAHQGRLDLPAPLILQEPPPLPPPSSSHQGYQSTSTA